MEEDADDRRCVALAARCTLGTGAGAPPAGAACRHVRALTLAVASTRSVSSRSSDTDELLSDLMLTTDELADVEEMAMRNRVRDMKQRLVEIGYREALDRAFMLLEVGGLDASCQACSYIAQVIDEKEFNESEVQKAHDGVLRALSRHGACDELCSIAIFALGATCSRLHRGIAAATKAVVLALRKHQSSASLLECTLMFFRILTQSFGHRLSEVFDANGSEAFVLALRMAAELKPFLQREFCNVLIWALPASTLDETLVEAGLIDVLLGILNQVQLAKYPKLSFLCYTALSRCLKQWPSIMDVLLQNDILDLIVAAGMPATGERISTEPLCAAWTLFLSIAYVRELSIEQLEPVLRVSVPWLNIKSPVADGMPVEFCLINLKVFVRCCSGSNPMRELAGRLNAVDYVLQLLRVTPDHAELLSPLLHALMELLHYKANRDSKASPGHVTLQLILKVMAAGVPLPELYERGFGIFVLLSQEAWFERHLVILRKGKQFCVECIRAVVTYFRSARCVDDNPERTELAYNLLLSIFADHNFDDDDVLRRAWARVLPVLERTVHGHLLAERSEQPSLLPLALQLIALVSPHGCVEVGKQELLDVMAVTILSLQMHLTVAAVQQAGCTALSVLLNCAPRSLAAEIAELLRDNEVAGLLSTAIREPIKDKALLAIVARALSSTAMALVSTHCDDDPRHLMYESVVPAALLLLQSAELHETSVMLLAALCQNSHKHRIKLATRPVIRALVPPLLSNSPVKHADVIYRVLRQLIESEDACVTHALEADLLKVKSGKFSCEDRREVEALLRQRRDADNEGAAANADAAAAELLAEEEAEAAAKLAAQQKRSSKAKKKAPRAAPAATAAADSAAPDEPSPEAEAAAEEGAAPSADAGGPEAAAGGSEADASQKPRGKRSGRGSRNKAQPGKAGDTDSSEAQQLDAASADAHADALSAAGAGSQPEEGFVPVETRKKGSRKQPAAEAAAPPSPAPAPPTQPRQRQQRELPQPQQQQPQHAAPPQPRPVTKPQPPPPVAPVMHPQPLPPPPSMPPVPVPMQPPLPYAQPPPAYLAPVPLMPWQIAQPARPYPEISQSQLPPLMPPPPQEPRAPQAYRPPPPTALPGSSSILPPMPSLFSSLNEQMAQVAITPRPDASGAGLSNAAGEYNCFLNSIVQALFHVHCFRDHLLNSILPGHAPNLAVQRSIALVSALGDLFQALQRGVVLRRSDAEAGAIASGEPQGAVAPTALRMALAALNAGGGEGAMNTMADAAEVLSALYDAFQSVSSAAATPRAHDETPIARMFGFGVREGAVCTAAGCRRKVTHELSFRSFFHIVFSTALRDAHAAAEAQGLRLSFEELLAQLQAGDVKRCDKDVGGCGAAARVRHNLEAPPRVFTISLAWDAAQAAEEVVAATMKALQPELRPELVFDNQPRYNEAGVYALRAMVCYYGSHYAAYARTDEADTLSFLPTKCVALRRRCALLLVRRPILTVRRA